MSACGGSGEDGGGDGGGSTEGYGSPDGLGTGWPSDGCTGRAGSVLVGPELEPTMLSRLLPLRTLMEEYLAGGFVCSGVSRPEGKFKPEAAFTQLAGAVTILRRFTPINSYPARVGDEAVTIREGSPARWGDGVAAPGVSYAAPGAAWSRPSSSLETHALDGVVGELCSLYSEPPLHLYPHVAVSELDRLSGPDSMCWRTLYSDSLTVPSRASVYGLLTDNCSVDIRPFEHSDDYATRSDPEARRLRPGWSGFLDPSYTVASTAAGRVRMLCHGVRIRLMTPTVAERIGALWSIVAAHECSRHSKLRVSDRGAKACAERESWTVWMSGRAVRVRSSCVPELTRAWRALRGHQTPSVHVWRAARVVTISGTSGCALRPLSTVGDQTMGDSDDEVWVDSLVFNDPAQRRELGIDERPDLRAINLRSTLGLLWPYTLYDQSPRPMLASIMSGQCIAYPHTALVSTVSPLRSSPPAVETPLSAALREDCGRRGLPPPPGVAMIVLFANLRDTYEDAVVASSALAASPLCGARGSLKHPVPPSEPMPAPGERISMSTHGWWRCATGGVVAAHDYSVARRRQVVVELDPHFLGVGDKVATCHGQKQTVSRVVAEGDMPLCRDTRNGREFRPHLVMASSSVHNRGTVGQIYEARAGCVSNDVSTFVLGGAARPYVTSVGGDDGPGLTATECTFTEPSSSVAVRDEKGALALADYGVCTVWLLAHLARDKQHFASAVPLGLRPPQTRSEGSPVRLGEAELLSMMSRGLIHCVSEALDSSDSVVVSVCTRCSRLSLLCDCGSVERGITGVVTRLGIVKLDISRAVYTVAAFHDEEERGVNQGPGAHRAPSTPASFRYLY